MEFSQPRKPPLADTSRHAQPRQRDESRYTTALLVINGHRLYPTRPRNDKSPGSHGKGGQLSLVNLGSIDPTSESLGSFRLSFTPTQVHYPPKQDTGGGGAKTQIAVLNPVTWREGAAYLWGEKPCGLPAVDFSSNWAILVYR